MRKLKVKRFSNNFNIFSYNLQTESIRTVTFQGVGKVLQSVTGHDEERVTKR
jgi:hypothetical protein